MPELILPDPNLIPDAVDHLPPAGMDDPVGHVFTAEAVLRKERIEKPADKPACGVPYVFGEDDPEFPLPCLKPDGMEE